MDERRRNTEYKNKRRGKIQSAIVKRGIPKNKKAKMEEGDGGKEAENQGLE